MTLLEWRKNPELLALASVVLDGSDVKKMLEVLSQANPAFHAVKVTDGFGATYELGLIRGFNFCLQCLSEMGKPIPEIDRTPLMTTWQAQETEKR